MKGLYKHLLVAFVWVFLIGNPSMGGMMGGLLGGYLLLVVFRRALSCEIYIRRVNGLIYYAFYFFSEVVKSNVRIALIAISKNAGTVKGHYIHYDVHGMSKLELLILSHSLNLTPGTIVARHTVSSGTIAIHSFPEGDIGEAFASIDKMRDRIMRFTR